MIKFRKKNSYLWAEKNYFWLKRDGDGNLKDTAVATFYKRALSPATIVAMLGVYYTFTLPAFDTIVTYCSALPLKILAYLFFVFTITLCLRMYDSLILAEEDYSTIKSRGLMDILKITSLSFVLSGGIFIAVEGSYSILGSFKGYLIPVYLLYACCALFGIIHFKSLRQDQLSKTDRQYIDLDIERPIQHVNIRVFQYFAWLLLAAATLEILLSYIPQHSNIIYSLTAGIIGLLILLAVFNLIHSRQLTKRPKFFLTNKPDQQESLLNLFLALTQEEKQLTQE
jgi:hypothetical protein